MIVEMVLASALVGGTHSFMASEGTAVPAAPSFRRLSTSTVEAIQQSGTGASLYAAWQAGGGYRGVRQSGGGVRSGSSYRYTTGGRRGLLRRGLFRRR